MKRLIVALAALSVLGIYMARQSHKGTDAKTGHSAKELKSGLTSSGGNKTSQTSEEAKDNPPHWYASLKRPEWWLVVAAFVTLFVIGWQAVETRRAAQATQKSTEAIEREVSIMERQTKATEIAAAAARDNAEAATKNIETFISKERARLRVDLKKLSLSPRVLSVYTVNFTVSIYGTTPAYIVETGCVAYVLPLADIDSTDAGAAVITSLSLLPKVISPNAPPLEQFAAFHLGGQHTEDIIAEIKNDRLFVGLRGFIKYRDVFDRDRETRFRYVWKFSTLFPPEQADRWGNWEKCGSERDNYET